MGFAALNPSYDRAHLSIIKFGEKSEQVHSRLSRRAPTGAAARMHPGSKRMMRTDR
jgi:hypothetical protein